MHSILIIKLGFADNYYHTPFSVRRLVDDVIYELICQAEQKVVLCNTTDLRVIRPLEGTKAPQIYIVHFQCPHDGLYSLNLCTAGHLDLIYYHDERLKLIEQPLSQQLLEMLLEKLEKSDHLTYEDFMNEIDSLGPN